MTNYLLPLKLKPAFQNYLWGGTKLRTVYHKAAPKNWQKVAESWELSIHPHGLSIIAGGPFAGQTFAEYLQAAGPKVLGKRFTKAHLPILIKFIDAADNLSIQVHPNDNYARKYENSSGKTEMWYVVAAEPGAFIYYGFKKKISAKEFKQRIADQTLPQVLKKIPVKAGDVFFIPAGTLHAIGKGSLIAEIQQSCDLTYRIYDYGRVGDDGKPRQLHIDKACDVTELKPSKQKINKKQIPLSKTARIRTLVEYQDFITKKITLDEGKLELLSLDDTYQALIVVKGKFTLIYQDKKYQLANGETIFLPAGLGTYHLQGKGELLLITDN